MDNFNKRILFKNEKFNKIRLLFKYYENYFNLFYKSFL